ncbi:hypothetical protein C2845_PM05G36990 [Panicum miliaceum]|uniref:Uncharacterized protein n=1 Tax=Panicum miliaceum TaxID=4540 RepID=A0A3L6SYB8_PANMI|nr:hypothetical protein C2845_PM05G36990 [Panicum miliaceum]
MDTDLPGRQQRQKQTQNNAARSVDEKQKAKTFPMSQASHLDIMQSEQITAAMKKNILSEAESDEEISRWEKFRELAMEGMDEGDCSKLFKAMELDNEGSDSNDDTELETSKNHINFTSTKRNLISELDECVDTFIPQDEQRQETQKKKQKWGPILLQDRPRRHTENGRTMLQKAADLKSVKNLDAEPKKGPEGKHKYHLSNWNSLAQWKEYGGWGISDVSHNPNIFCCREIGSSPFWKGVLWAYKAAQTGIRWKIGDGRSVRFWEDWWCGNCSLVTQFWDLYIISNQKNVSIADVWDGTELQISFRRGVT